ncbi:MAG TPA: PD-(D/E)XK nuclease family protein [Verrucomicrobiota bacterium]|nr:PD-(D/E)XK nuclease family protein [Verrucomicrobiota bacterium]HNU51369.1 PD-(D/E)XK nuclease family protein [Verrucomicrobiota bacterium]
MSGNVVFLGWDRPWALLFADWLAQAPDRLRRRLVVVPTRESGRRLRECLLKLSQDRGAAALLGPRLATPNDFFRPETPIPNAIRWAGWVHVLRNTRDAAVETLFPSGISSKDDGWRLGVARQIEQARELLAAEDTDFAATAMALPADAQRFSELARLERHVTALWTAWGWPDPVAAKRQRATHPIPPQGVDEVIVAGIADPTGLAIKAWRQLAAQHVAFTILVGAPSSLRNRFDEWGIPNPEAWTHREHQPTPLPTAAFVAADPVSLAEATVQASAGKPNHELAVGVCDPSFTPALSRRFIAAGWPTFDPRGVTPASDGWPELLEALAAAAEAPSDYSAIARVTRHPIVWQQTRFTAPPEATLAALDRWEAEHGTPDAAIAIRWLRAGTRNHQAAAAQRLETAQRLVAPHPPGPSDTLEASLRQWIAEAQPEIARHVSEEMASWPQLDNAGFSLPLRLRWLAASLAAISVPVEVQQTAFPLEGWLELPFNPAPHLVLAALHEGRVPQTPSPDPLITEAVRETLRLRDRQSRLARDIFLYTALVEGRRSQGSVTVITAQVDPRGEPCRPSRLLLQAAAHDLPARVLQFVKEKPDAPRQPTPALSRGTWQLHVPPETPRNLDWTRHSLSPSTLRVYLACPTRFFFSRVLGWETVEPFSGELTGGRFGDLLHAVLRQWGEDQQSRELSDPTALKRCWTALLKQEVTAHLGRDLPPLLRLQVLSAEERLLALAEHQAAQRQAGWHVLQVEAAFNDVLSFAGVPVHLRVDRIDRHDDGRIRVLDYKTGRRPRTPAETHLRVWTEAGCPCPLGPLLPGAGKASNRLHGWSDLQLPLYVAAVRRAMNLDASPEASYILLPEAVSETGFAPFDHLEEKLDNALLWAEHAARRIVEGVFWPPAPDVEFDPLARLIPDGIESALGEDWRAFLSSDAQERKGTVA